MLKKIDVGIWSTQDLLIIESYTTFLNLKRKKAENYLTTVKTYTRTKEKVITNIKKKLKRT